MASIRTQLELYDAVSAPLDNITNSLYDSVQAFTAMESAANNSLDAVAYNRMEASIDAGNVALNEMEQNINENVEQQHRHNRAIENGSSALGDMSGKIFAMVAAYASLQTIEKVLDLSDTLTLTTARLDMMNDGLQTTQQLQDMIFLAAERSRGSYEGSADAVAKMGIMAEDAFNSNYELISFVEQLNKQFTIAGTSQEGISAAMLQLTQAMGSGVLRGEELNSVFKQAPTIIQTIADYLEVPIGTIRAMAQEGQLTADVVKNALLSAADETNAKFEQMPMTFGQIATSMSNNTLMAFQPVLKRLNDIANSDSFEQMVSGMTSAFVVVSGVVIEVFDLIAQIGGFIAENWSIIEPIILGVAAAMAIYTAALLINKGVQLTSAAATGISAVMTAMHTAFTSGWTIATFAQTVAQQGLNAALLACPLTWIIILVIAIIALFYAVVAAVNKFAGTSVSATGIICGAFMAALAFIGNIFIALWNLVVDVFVLIYNLIAEVANFVGNVFTDPIGAIARLFFGLADTVLGILQALAAAIDAVFGSNLAGSVQGWRDSLGGWVDDTFGKGTEVMAKMNADDMKLDRFEYGAAYDMGYEFGQGIDEKIAGFDPANLFDSNVPGADDYSSVPGNLADTAANTGKVASSVDISQEDLKYLRDLAETEVVNRFTTAEIKVEMHNNNNINSNMDLDGVVDYLVTGLGEAMDRAAERVHD